MSLPTLLRSEEEAVRRWTLANKNLTGKHEKYLGRITRRLDYVALSAQMFSGRPLYQLDYVYTERDPLYDA